MSRTWPRERRIAIVGAGAIGSRLAAHFSQRGIAATLFDGWAEHVAALRSGGICLEHPDGRREQGAPLPALGLDAPDVPSGFDLVIVAVRSDDTAPVLPLVRRLLAEDGCVLSCQNGVNEDAIAAAVGAHRTLGCSMVFGARLVGPGQVRILPGPDVLRSGEWTGGSSDRLRQVVDLLSCAGHSTATDNLVGYRWMKLALNATGNTLLLLTGETAGQLHARAEARRIIIALVREILGTACALGIEPEPVLDQPTAAWVADDATSSAALHQALRAHGEMLGTRRLSMVADYESRGRTEVDHINGYVVRKAEAAGRAAPGNQAVWRMVRELEADRRRPGLHTLEELRRHAH